MRRCLVITLVAIMAAFVAPAVFADDTRLPYDTIKLTTGYTIYGKAEAHPSLEDHTIVRFSNGGWQTLKNIEIESILPNSSAKDQFERREVSEG